MLLFSSFCPLLLASVETHYSVVVVVAYFGVFLSLDQQSLLRALLNLRKFIEFLTRLLPCMNNLSNQGGFD